VANSAAFASVAARCESEGAPLLEGLLNTWSTHARAHFKMVPKGLSQVRVKEKVKACSPFTSDFMGPCEHVQPQRRNELVQGPVRRPRFLVVTRRGQAQVGAALEPPARRQHLHARRQARVALRKKESPVINATLVWRSQDAAEREVPLVHVLVQGRESHGRPIAGLVNLCVGLGPSSLLLEPAALLSNLPPLVCHSGRDAVIVPFACGVQE
jgi:hypothetical protein